MKILSQAMDMQTTICTNISLEKLIALDSFMCIFVEGAAHHCEPPSGHGALLPNGLRRKTKE